MNNLDIGIGFSAIGLALGALFGVMASMAANEYRGSKVESGTVVYPTEQQCIIETHGLCEFTSIGIYTPIKDI